MFPFFWRKGKKSISLQSLNYTLQSNNRMRRIICFLFLIVLMVGCSKDEVTPEVDTAPEVDTSGAILFTASRPSSYITRNMIENVEALQSAGFGVFAYYTGSYTWNLCDGSGEKGHTSKVVPNFMYNQQVEWSTDHWTYSPVKYWPNNNNPADGSGAIGSESKNYLSFFAYAPYGVSYITGFSANDAAGAPSVNYTWGANNDLLYAAQTDRYKYDNSDDANDNGRIGETVLFNFRHALCKVQFKVRRSNTSHAVSLKSLSVSFNTTATFNLGSATWSSHSGSGSSNVFDASLSPISVTAETEASAHEVGSPIMLIPGALTTYNVTYTVGGSKFTHTAAPFESGLIPSSGASGCQYTIIFTIDGDAIKVDRNGFTEQW